MRLSNRLLIVVVCVMLSAAAAYYQAQTVPDLVAATNSFLASLTPEQTAKVKFNFSDEERFNWHFIPRERKGLPFKEMQPHQQRLAFAMMSAALGQRGFVKATTIMSLEDVLRELEAARPQFQRDPELHFISIFGEPSTTGTWGWRLEGHHIAVNVTMDKGKFLASTPTMLGSNPAEVREGPRKGLRALAAEEDLGRQLLESLDATQKQAAVFAERAPNDIVTGNSRQAMMLNPMGLKASSMNARQKDMLLAIIREYAERNAAEAAAATLEEVRTSGIDNVYFAWAGPATRGQAHYYRVQGPTFLIEYDNSQNQANHIHSVWRDLKNDFGVDELAEHYRASHIQNAE